jgi:hypothetical protein
MNCLPILSEEEFKKSFQITQTPDDDQNLCVICFERKIDVILKCFVSLKFYSSALFL